MRLKDADPSHSAEETIIRLEELRENRFAKRATIIWMPENNLHGYAYALQGVLNRGVLSHRFGGRKVRLCNYIMYISKNGKYGVKTDATSKSIGSNIMYTKVRANMLLIWEHASKTEFRELVDQMRRWRMVMNKHGTRVYKAPGGKSDHIMSFLVGCFGIDDWPISKHLSLEKVGTGTSNLCDCESGLCGQAPILDPMKRIPEYEERVNAYKRRRI